MNFKPNLWKIAVSVILGILISFLLLKNYFGGNFLTLIKNSDVGYLVLSKFIFGILFYVGLIYVILSLIQKKK